MNATSSKTAIFLRRGAEDRRSFRGGAQSYGCPVDKARTFGSVLRAVPLRRDACGLKKPARWTSPFFERCAGVGAAFHAKSCVAAPVLIPREYARVEGPHARRCSERRERQLRNRDAGHAAAIRTVEVAAKRLGARRRIVCLLHGRHWRAAAAWKNFRACGGAPLSPAFGALLGGDFVGLHPTAWPQPQRNDSLRRRSDYVFRAGLVATPAIPARSAPRPRSAQPPAAREDFFQRSGSQLTPVEQTTILRRAAKPRFAATLRSGSERDPHHRLRIGVPGVHYNGAHAASTRAYLLDGTCSDNKICVKLRRRAGTSPKEFEVRAPVFFSRKRSRRSGIRACKDASESACFINDSGDIRPDSGPRGSFSHTGRGRLLFCCWLRYIWLPVLLVFY